MSTQIICNKCGSVIKIGISSNKDSHIESAEYYKLELHKYAPSGRLIDEKEYHLCAKCKKLFNLFLNPKLYNMNKENEPMSENELHNILIKDSNINNSCNIDDYTYTIPRINDTLNDKSIMIIENNHYTTKKFNRFQKYMWKKAFGITIIEKENN